MALVAYDNSDSSDYEDDNTEEPTGINPQVVSALPATKPLPNGQTSLNDKNLFNLLPKPTNLKTELEEDDEILHKKETVSEIKPKSKITVPSLDDFKDVKDTAKSNIKPRVKSGKLSGLLSILPEPKNSAKVSSKMLIPQSVSKKPIKNILPSPLKKAKVETKSLITDYSDESDDDVQNDFFSMNKPEVILEDGPLDIDVKPEPTTKEPRTLESYFKKEEHVLLEPDSSDVQYDTIDPNMEQPDYGNIPAESSANVLDEEAILKLCGTRGKRKREEIQIVDIDQQEVLRDAREMLLKGLMDDTTTRQSQSKKKGTGPTSQQKRKHQITYLAHQAKANEAELQNQWANNRMTKRQTQSKYGF